MFILCGLGFLAFVAGLIALQVGPYHYGGSYSGDALDYFLYNMWDGNGGAYKNLGSWGLLGAGILMVGGALMALGSFIYLCVRVGDRDAQGKIILRGIDRWYTEIQLLKINLRDPNQQPKYDSPRLISPVDFDFKDKTVLLVEDRIKTGATVKFAIDLLQGARQIKTFAVNGNADYALFNEDCFKFPWIV